MKHFKYFLNSKRESGAPVPQLSRASSPTPENWPSDLSKLHNVATSALKDPPGSSLPQDSERQRAGDDDLVTVMRAMADPNRTAAVYFAIAEAMGGPDGQPLSDRDLAEAEEICRGFGQEPLTEEEKRAIERLASRRKVPNGG